MKPLSRQRRWQLLQISKGKCPRCSNPLAPGMAACVDCAVRMREATRRRRQARTGRRTKKRYFTSPSYAAAAEVELATGNKVPGKKL